MSNAVTPEKVDDFEIVREALEKAKSLSDALDDHGGWHLSLDALKALARIRERTLPRLPDGWHIRRMDNALGYWFCAIAEIGSEDEIISIDNDSPRAAVDAAIEKINKGE